MSPSAVVLDGAECAGFDDFDAIWQGFLLGRSGFVFLECLGFLKADFVAGLEEGWLLAIRIEQDLIGVTDHVPSAL